MSPDCIPLPPDITIFAEVNSGLSLFANSSETNSLIFADETASIDSTGTSELSDVTGSKAVDLTVINLTESFDFTVAMQLPA